MSASERLSSRLTVKLVDVARLAGCSPATVSRVLNGNTKVGRAERENVLRVAVELGYVPNGSARALRSSKSRIVGAIIPTLDHAIYATMVDALQARLSEREVSLIINTSHYDLHLELTQTRLLVERGAESIVLVGSQHLEETLNLLRQTNVDAVFTYTCKASSGAAAVGFDNRKAGATAARFLHELGHRRLAMIAGITKDNDRAQGRLDGFRDELAQLGVDPDSVLVVESTYSVGSGRNAMHSVLSTHPSITAVFCGSDIIAAGAVKYCQANGIDIPGQVSVVGFDNLEIAELITPELTTIEVPAREMGTQTAAFILADPDRRAQMREQELQTRLIYRSSTGPARPGAL